MSTGTDGAGTDSTGPALTGQSTRGVIGDRSAGRPASGTRKWLGNQARPAARDLADDNVSAPADQVPALREIVAKAAKDNHDVHFVVLTERQPVSPTIATSPPLCRRTPRAPSSLSGPMQPAVHRTSSARHPEQATDNLKFADQTQAARQMYDKMTEPSINWTVATLVLIVVVVVGAVAARLLGRRTDVSGPEEGVTEEGVTEDAANRAARHRGGRQRVGGSGSVLPN